MRNTAKRKAKRRVYQREYMRRYRRDHKAVWVPRKKVEKKRTNESRESG